MYIEWQTSGWSHAVPVEKRKVYNMGFYLARDTLAPSYVAQTSTVSGVAVSGTGQEEEVCGYQ